MGNHHDNHHSEEKKPVSFAVPFYMALTTLLVIFSLVSLGDPCKETCCAGGGHGTEASCENGQGCSKECAEACKKGDHSKHPAAAAGTEKKEEHAAH